ncbi:MAG: TonB-dependent siderophore receptor [Pseudomonadota bacterium]
MTIRRSCDFVCTLAFLLLCFDFAAAQDADFAASPRQAYWGSFGLNETPAAVQDVDFGIMREGGALRLEDALDLAASIARQSDLGGLWDRFSVRGLGMNDALPSAMLVNGFSAGRGVFGQRDIVGIERVEVLKGPRAALLGRGGLSGTLNIVTTRPTFERAGEMRAIYGSFDTLRFELDYDTPIKGEKVAARVTGFFEDADSFRDTIETQSYALYPSIAWTINQDTTLSYELEWAEQNRPLDRGIAAVDGALEALPIEAFFGAPADGNIETSAFGHQLEIQHQLSTNWSLLAGLNYRETSLSGFSTEAELAPQRQTLFQDNQTLARQRRFRDFDTQQVVIRAELAGAFKALGVTHRLLAGVDYDWFALDALQNRFQPPLLSSLPSAAQSNAIGVFDLNASQGALPELQPFSDLKDTQQALGVYIQDQIALSDKLELRLGGRLEEVEQSVDDALFNASLERSDTRFSAQAGLVYFLNPVVSLYTNYAQGFEQPVGRSTDGDLLPITTSTSAEFGVKADLFGSITATIAGFWMQQHNTVATDPADGEALLNVGDARSLGVEVDINAALPKDIYLWLSYAFVDAQFTGERPALGIEDGSQLPNIPKHQISLQLSKSVEYGSVFATYGGGLVHVGSRNGALGNDFTLPSYTTLRAFAQVEPLENLRLRLDVDNIFDKRFYTNALSTLWVEPGAPRRFRFTASILF